MVYAQVDTKTVEQLTSIVGPEFVDVDPIKLDNFGHDETPLYHTTPEVVVHPVNTHQVAQIMKLAYDRIIPVTPRGGGTNLSGGAVPLHRGIVLSLDRMNRVKEIDTENLMVITEPGVITAELEKKLSSSKLFFPPDPVSLESCTIGGNVAECAGGPRAMKYGVTKNYVTGLEVVLPNGEILRLGGRLLKNVTGYDLIDLFVGSEGTLGIVTEITLEVLPLPEVTVDLLIPFDHIFHAVKFTGEILRQGAAPTAVEYMDGNAVRLTARFLEKSVPFNQAGGTVIVELDGNDPQEVQRRYEKVGAAALALGVDDVLVGDNGPDREKIWEPRKKIGEALKSMTRLLCREDLVVPKNQIPQLIEKLRVRAGDYQADLYAFGHLGDGNIHTDLVVNNDGKNGREPKSIHNAKMFNPEMVMKLRRDIYQITLDLGGMITAEHGVGLAKKDFLTLALNHSVTEKMQQIKKIFDPKNILNPGKIFPE